MRKFEYVSRVKETEDGQIKIPLFELPTRSTMFSAGYDFINPEEVEIQAGQIKYVRTGIKAKFPEDEMLLLCNRSSNPKKKGLVLANGIGVVDSDYYNNDDNEGEIAFAFMNIAGQPIVLQPGEKLGQGIFVKYGLTADDNANTIRISGFGSTGK